MLEIEALEASIIFEALLNRVRSGEEILITRRCKPVARLVPQRACGESEQIGAAAARILARSAQIGHSVWAESKRDRDAGRP